MTLGYIAVIFDEYSYRKKDFWRYLPDKELYKDSGRQT